MRDLEEIKKIIYEYKDEFKKEYGVFAIGVFGSYSKEEQKKTSDIDILMEFQKPIDLFAFVHLKNHLSELLGLNVDLVMKKALKPNIRKKILEEVVYI